MMAMLKVFRGGHQLFGGVMGRRFILNDLAKPLKDDKETKCETKQSTTNQKDQLQMVMPF